MTVIFNLDGTETHISEVFDLQVSLVDTIESHKSHLRSGYDELRLYRDDELKASDWTQVPNGPLDSTTKAAWATYRTKLRDLPGDAKAPYWFEESAFPLAPGASEINPEAVSFIKSNTDPLGIGTTSWVGITTTMIEKGSLTVDSSGPIGVGTDIVGIADTTGVEVGDTVASQGLVVGIVAGITTVNISLASTSPVDIDTSLEYSRVGDIYYAQDRPELTASVSAAATTVVAGAGISFTITLTNQGSPQDLVWSTNYDYDGASSSGTMTLTPVGTTGIGTVNVGVASDWQSDDLFLQIAIYNSSVQASASVGVTTT